VSRAKLSFHALGYLLQVHISGLVAVLIVDLLEAVQIDEDKAKNASAGAAFMNERFQLFFEREPVGDVGEQVELRAVDQRVVEVRRFDGQFGESGSQYESRRLFRAGLDEARNGGEERAKANSRPTVDFIEDNALRGDDGWTLTEGRAVFDLAPGGSATQLERNQACNLLNDLFQGARTIEVFEDQAAPPLQISQSRGFVASFPFQIPTPGAHREHDDEKEAH